MSSFRELVHLSSPLYSYLISDEISFISFIQDPQQAGILVDMAYHKGSFIFSSSHYSKNVIAGRSSPVYNLDWKPTQQWPQAALTELRKLLFKRVVFFFCIEQIPLQLIEELEKCGCNEFIYREANQWRRIDASQSRSGFTSWLKRFRTIRKVLLNILGRKLPLDQHASHIASGGYSYRVRLPNNVTQGSSLKNLRSDILLFEDDCRLDLSSTPVAEIITEGKGRFCQQGLDLFFSASDNSDPRFNQRCYRFINLRGPFKNLNHFFYSLSQGLPELNSPPIEFETTVQDLIAQRCKLGLELNNIENVHDNSSGPICLFSGSLGPGGTERQLAYVAKYLSNAGKDVHIFTCEPLSEIALHYYPLLPTTTPVNIHPITHPNTHFQEEDLFVQSWGQKTLSLFLAMPDYMSEPVWNLYTHLMAIKPKVLHCWLDYPNVIGAMAGWLAGVPRIILSTRNRNPSHFPRFYCSWYQLWYQHLCQLPKVKLIGNSETGIKDYSAWLSIPRSQFSLIRNGVDYSIIKPSGPDEIKHFRQDLNIEETAPVIAGIFRLDLEKRPFTFLEVVTKIKERLPKLKVVMAGIGTLEEAVRKKIVDLKAESWISFLGRRQDVPLIISSCDIVLLVSSEEGTPNILLEAQWLEKPVVCTHAGGVAEIVEDGKTGYICPQDDIDGLVEACCSLLNSSELRQTFGAAGKQLVGEHFSVEKMISDTLAFYDEPALVRS